MAAGTLLEWKVKPGDRVKRGDIIAVVDTDKAAIEIEVFEDGVIEELLIEPGQKVPVGTIMAIIRSEEAPSVSELAPSIAATGTEKAAEIRKVPKGIEKPRPIEEAPRMAPYAEAGVERTKASPYARRLAVEHSIDLGILSGTGPDGVICAADVERAIALTKEEIRKEPPIPSIAEEPVVPPAPEMPFAMPTAEKAAGDYQTAMRRATAAAMARSNREIPHYYLKTRIDMSVALRWLESENLRRPIKERILPAVLLLKGVALALTDVPELNGYWMDDRHQPQEAINIGFAISMRQGGLITPAILHVDLKSVDELMEALRDLITRARAGRLRSSEMTDATVTVTNLGDLGVEEVYGVIYPPQVALIGFGKIMEQPWAESRMMGVRPILTATLAADHRATDGRRGAQFLDALNRYLQEPTKL
jgi:pyruvate dehydrogenase E2 component (dihydrolipoamide acetyltransferase)